jgi:adenylylsulfate kinase-like enzyme
MAQRIIGEGRYFEAYLAAGIEACEQRDSKGLYAKARRGEIAEFTGINAPYETPTSSAIVVDTAAEPLEQCVDALLAALLARVAMRAGAAPA